MSSYFKLRSGLARGVEDGTAKKKVCTYKDSFFYRDATGRLAEINVYEDGAVYRSAASFRCQLNEAWPGKPGQKTPVKWVEIPGEQLGVPVGAVPCEAAEYEAALQLVLEAEKKAAEERAKEEELKKSLKKGMVRNQHAAEEASEAEPLSVALERLGPEPHFLDDFTVLDFETSDSFAIELAAVRVQNWQIVEQMQSFIRFRGQLNSYTKSLTGITSADLWNAPEEKAVLQQFKKLAGDSLLVAHNAPFDLRHLEAARTRQGAKAALPNPFLCSVVVAKSRYPAPHKLGELCARFGIAVVGAHRALNDVLMTYQLLQRMHQQEPIPAALVGATSVAKAKKATAQPSLFAAA